ncbi:dTDP-4-amino-4,6-dideoxygalactose transaminase [Pseudohaliea sp.]|uniref:dTDP-4-amino-4,6-dideoxygalactose transaminase n=1 Tax=Pseudohaliea sp. TaxID=2740289 RepID=UPI0032EA9897
MGHGEGRSGWSGPRGGQQQASTKMIPYNAPTILGTEGEFIQRALASGRMSGDGYFSRECERWLEQQTGACKAMMVPSCTAALEMAALLVDIGPGDEVIMPSFTFVSTANAFALRGATIVFVDIRPDTLNIDETLIQPAFTERTRAIVPVHYAGVGCAMREIQEIADETGVPVLEDAAQGLLASVDSQPLGAIGDLGCVSFHETKNLTAGGEGGALLLNNESMIRRAEIIRDKGTDRSQFFRGEVDKYSWRDLGSSYLMSELQAAYLHAQFTQAQHINEVRLAAWHYYHERLFALTPAYFTLPQIPGNVRHNAHIFYLVLPDADSSAALGDYLRGEGVLAIRHYVPLHSSSAGKRFGRFHGEDRYTSCLSERLLRLPLWFGITREQQDTVCELIETFWKS